jgi:Acetyltransferase (GNAT) domain
VEEEALARRHGVAPVHTLEEIELLAGRFPDGIKLFTARDDGGALLGGVVVFVTPVLAHAQYIAATEDGQARGAVDAIVEHLLAERYTDRRWFDFGISTTEQGRVLNEGLVGNKESYGARAIAYDTYELEVA